MKLPKRQKLSKAVIENNYSTGTIQRILKRVKFKLNIEIKPITKDNHNKQELDYCILPSR